MTSNQGKLLGGVVALVILWVLMWITQRENIERDVAQNVTGVLSDAGLDWIEVNTRNHGRDVYLSGIAREKGQGEAAEILSLGARGVRMVDISAIEYRPWQPATIDAEVVGGRVNLSGAVQTEALAAGLSAGISDIFDTEVIGEIKVDPDIAQTAWVEGLPTALGSLAAVENLKVSVLGANLRVTGTAREERLLTAAASLEERLDGIDHVDVSALALKPWSPSGFSLTFDGSTPVLSGVMHSSADTDRLVDIIGKVTPGVMDLRLVADADVAPAEWLDDLALLSAKVDAVESLSLSQSDGVMSVAGTVRSEDEFQRIAATAAKMTSVDVLDLESLDLRPFTPPWLEVHFSERNAVIAGSVHDAVLVDSIVARLSGGGLSTESQIAISPDTLPAEWGDDLEEVVALVSGMDQGSLVLRDQELTVNGIIRDPGAFDRILAGIAQSQWSEVADTANLALRPWKSPAFSVVHAAGSVLVSGLVGQRESANQLDMAARHAFGEGVSTQILLDPDVTPAAWKDDVIRLLPVVAGVEGGSLLISAGGAEISGVTRTADEYQRVESALPGMDIQIENTVALRPYVTPSMVVIEEDGTLYLEGSMPDQAALNRVESRSAELARERGLSLSSSLGVVQDVRDPGWLESLSNAIPLLLPLNDPAIQVSAQGVIVQGSTDSLDIAESLMAAVGGLAEGLSVQSNITLVDSALLYPDIAPEELDQCESGMDNLLVTNRIEFEFGSAELSNVSHGVLIDLAGAIESCPDVIIEVSGHTDNVGDEESNLVLSRQRAFAVVDFLVGQGMTKEKLVARGYGSSLPRADNATEAGQAENRRIEFNIKMTR